MPFPVRLRTKKEKAKARFRVRVVVILLKKAIDIVAVLGVHIVSFKGVCGILRTMAV